MTDQNVVYPEKDIDETTATPSQLQLLLARIVQDIKQGNKKLSAISSENKQWNFWDLLTQRLGIEDCTPETLQSYRSQVKHYFLDLLQAAGFTGDVCKDCIDPLDMHENSDHVPSVLETIPQEPNLSATNDLQLIRQLYVKEREDFRTYCLKRASYHHTLGNFAIILGGIIFVLPYIFWYALPADVYHAFARKIEEFGDALVDRILSLINR